MFQRPRRRHCGSERDAADDNRPVARGVVQGGAIAVDQATRMRNGRHQHRPGASQGGGKCSPDVVVVRSGSRQQHGCDPIQIDSHPLIVPATLGCSKANGGAREPTGLRWPLT
ncbi:Uncharacterised protein [Mycobacterium tuberculosis]|uniref:Uncharacterized protein n=1 Tax=Mycobacterium tuberculosis TaxID=1773 RepID=A0A0U0R7B2_MYCTX|nr:Uncharacterised protein [Mycobacterium tuberculosis]